MTRIKFDECSFKTTKKGKCAGGCGKSLKRTKTFTQTVNPFNKNKATGLPKTYREVQQAVTLEGERWESIPVICEGCLDEKGLSIYEWEAICKAA